MCRSIAEGGQRCAAHTRAAYTAAQRDVLDNIPGAHTRLHKASIEYASTREGNENFQQNADLASAEGDHEAAAEANSIVMWGSAMKAANDEARHMIHAANRPREFVLHQSNGWFDVTVHAGVFDENAREAFQSGQCFSLAAAISEKTGWPIVVRERIDPDTWETSCSHAWVKTPTGTYIDCVGETHNHPEDTDTNLDEEYEWGYEEILTGHIPAARHDYENNGLPKQNMEAARTFAQPVLDLYNSPTRHHLYPWLWPEVG